jgi:hypothetical protein
VVKQPGHGADHPSQSSTEVKLNNYIYTPIQELHDPLQGEMTFTYWAIIYEKKARNSFVLFSELQQVTGQRADLYEI